MIIVRLKQHSNDEWQQELATLQTRNADFCEERIAKPCLLRTGSTTCAFFAVLWPHTLSCVLLVLFLIASPAIIVSSSAAGVFFGRLTKQMRSLLLVTIGTLDYVGGRAESSMHAQMTEDVVLESRPNAPVTHHC